MNFLSMARKLGPSGWLLRPAMISAIVVAALVGAIAQPVNPSETDPATALISRARAALGHGEIKSLHLAGIFNSGDINGTVETWIDVADGRFASNTNAGPLTEAYGFDGHGSWRSDSKGIVLPQTGPLAKAITANAIFDNDDALFSPGYGGATVSYLGTRKDNGKTYEAISAKPLGGYAEEEWFDPATALPARTIVDYGAETETTYLSGYRVVGGLMIPLEKKVAHRLDVRDFYGHNQGNISHDQTYKYTVAEADIGDVERHFSMPPSAISDVSLPGGETSISFMLQNFWILINVRLNGKGPFQLMLDSGGRNILSPSVAWQVGATDTGTVPITTSYSFAKPLRFVRVASVEIGGATLTQQDFVVGGVGNIFTRDGMIGFEVFERLLTTIDYANRQIILRRPGNVPDAAKTSAASEPSLPLLFDDTKPATACKIAGTDATCIVDTGAALALVLSGPLVKANPGIKLPWYAGAYGAVHGSGGASEVRIGPVSSFQIGPFTMSDVETLFTTSANGALAEYPSALLGNRVLQRFAVTFDYSHAVLRLTPNASYDQH
jgi:hypothetical protein